jgi:signal transduction histidine kinase
MVRAAATARLRRGHGRIRDRGVSRGTLAGIGTRAATIFSLFVMVTLAIDVLRQYAPILTLESLYVFVVMPVALIWGFGLGFATALASFVTCSYFFISPTHSLAVNSSAHLLVLVLSASAALVGGLIGAEGRRRQDMLLVDQAALRHLAALVRQRSSPRELFATIAEETGRVVGAQAVRIARYEPDGGATLVALWSTLDPLGSELALGQRLSLDSQSAEARVLRSQRVVRIDDTRGLEGWTVERLRRNGVRSELAAPIVVDGHAWGALVASSTDSVPFPAGTEARIANFAEMAVVDVANAETRVALLESRGRTVAAADEARKRLERDLHDAIQQQLLLTALRLRDVRLSLPAELEAQRAALEEAAGALTRALEELRLILRGLNPPALATGGLAAAVRSLARRFPFPIRTDLELVGRLPEPVEQAAFYVVCEALTNAAKHASCSSASVAVEASGAALKVRVADDGVGGANPSAGSGLRGMADRAEALGGWLTLSSPAGRGTSIELELPLAGGNGVAGKPLRAGATGSELAAADTDTVRADPAWVAPASGGDQPGDGACAASQAASASTTDVST